MKKRKKKSLYEEFSMLLLFLIAAFTYFQTNSLESVFTTVIAVGVILLFIPLFLMYRRKQKLCITGQIESCYVDRPGWINSIDFG
ncbi:hypothetical protein AWH48_08455 [Domibacillus aminovorans]|uniref:Uncharacterized protein n=1 Tax=Domibacillus aminovorans TaxID=29332 RepID=A0A177KML3_9BACI|nr:hypothetical protein [Domibacillus aminovorans]OAH54613.1 hypothetical protein AWH48_08455 [Domibacillus aminovorans]